MDNIQTNDEVSIKQVLLNVRTCFKYLLRQWWKLVIAATIGGLFGLAYSYIKPVTYTAKLSFILEEGKSSTGSLSSLAGQFGFDLGSLAGNNGPLSSDNVTLFLTSNSLNLETLLTPYDSSAKYSLADRYAEVSELRKKWKNNSNIGVEVFFPPPKTFNYTRLQDSLLQVIVAQILKKDISISKPDRKASFVEVTTTMRDELLSKFYCERLVKMALDRYIQIKTTTQLANIERLQKRADSIAVLLNNRTFSSAYAQEKIIDLNPALRSATVSSELIGRDKTMLATIYAEVVKNLEISKVALGQETPVMQIIDNVMLPLGKNEIKKPVAVLIGGFIALFIACLFLGLQFLILKEYSK